MTEIVFLQHYPANVTIPVHWGEQDGFGHVNNAVFIKWFESARIQYMNLVNVELTNQGIGPILAAVSCNFSMQVKYPDTIISGARISAIGRSSIAIEHAIWSQAQSAIVADGKSTVVMFDYTTQTSSPVSDDIRERVEKIQRRH